nr:MAG TPA: hypothetical protein [Caudoviricetes sp.]
MKILPVLYGNFNTALRERCGKKTRERIYPAVGL